MRIAIIGIGFLGTKLFNFFSKENEVFGAEKNPQNSSIEQIDATNKEDLRAFLLKHKPNIVMDTVGLASTLACEKDPELCKKLNYETAKNIADICKEINAKLIFISSSYVFDGEKGNYNEQDIPTPTNEYAKMKVLAEKEVLKSPNSIVIRTEPMYGYDENSKQIRFGGSSFDRDVELGFTELIRNPIFIEDVPETISKLIAVNQSGIFHIGGAEKTIWSDFLRKLSSRVNAKSKIKTTDDSDWLVKSPKDSSLDISKINSLGIQTISPDEAMEKIRNSYNN